MVQFITRLQPLLDAEEEERPEGAAILTTSATAAAPLVDWWAASNGRAPALAFVMLTKTADAPCFVCEKERYKLPIE